MIIFDKAELFNCVELEELSGGAYGGLRFPMNVMTEMSELGRAQSRRITGIELRFVINSGDVKIKLRTTSGELGEATVYHGEFVADWPETTKFFGGNESEITIIQSPNIKWLHKIARENNHRFSPDVVRILFEGARPEFISIEGDISLPTPDMLPKRTYFAYGSSITHGSISLHPNYYYTTAIGKHFGAEVYNKGCAGSACLEKAVADFIAEKCEFDFASLEMGINILNIAPEEYERRVRYFVKRIAEAHPNAPIFAIDVFLCESDIYGDGKAERFREILERVCKEFNLPNLVYVNGKTVLTSVGKLSTGLCHPGPEGIREMGDNLIKIMSERVKP